MTIAEALRDADTMKPNRFERAKKVAWLAQVEGQIYREIVCTHENPEGIREPEIDNNTDPDHRLIAPFPYDDIYTLWLACRIDLGNMEIGKYNNNRTLFNNALITLRDYWNRTYLPLTCTEGLNFGGEGGQWKNTQLETAVRVLQADTVKKSDAITTAEIEVILNG